MEETLEYMSLWQGDMSETLNLDATQHPCAIIPQVFVSGNSENNSTNLMQIESFMESYSAKRNLPGIFRATSSCVAQLYAAAWLLLFVINFLAASV